VSRLATVHRRLEIDETLPLFDPTAARPIVIATADAPADRRVALNKRADVLVCGRTTVDLAAALTELRTRHGASVVLTEGGPSLLGGLAAAGCLDELCTTIAPCIVGGDSRRMVVGAPPQLETYTLGHVLEQDGLLFLRHVRRPAE